MRILMMCYEFPPLGGGAGRVVNGLCRQLARSGDEVTVMTMRYRGLPPDNKLDGFHVRRIPCVRLKKYYCTIPEVATYLASGFIFAMRLVRSYKPDIIHAHFIFPDGLIARVASFYSRVPYLITAHGTDVPDYNPHRARSMHRLMSFIWRKTAQSAGNVICPSLGIRRLVKLHAPDARTRVIPNGYEINRFRRSHKKNRIIAVSRLLERKGIQYLIQAVADTDIHWEIVIAGDGPYMEELQQMAKAAKSKIHFAGWLENGSDKLNSLYESSSIFVFPSEAENFPICLLEAMLSRNAIITTQGTGCEEVVGSTALLVPSKDPRAIREALDELMKNDELRIRLAELAHTRARKLFDWSMVAKKYQYLYRKCAYERRVPI